MSKGSTWVEAGPSRVQVVLAGRPAAVSSVVLYTDFA